MPIMTTNLLGADRGLLSGDPSNTFMPRMSASTYFRTQLYDKNSGSTSSIHASGLMKMSSPISGELLVSPAITSSPMSESAGGVPCRAGVRDPIAGCVLHLEGQRAIVTFPIQKQQLIRTRGFYLTKDIDNTIQTLRSTTKVNRYTNEKVGTAGTPTGLDNTLYKSA